MLTKRIIPCMDVTDGRVVKGVNFVDLIDVGDPVEIASYYEKQGADEIVFLDITATHNKEKTMINMISRCAKKVFMPLTVGGGITTTDDIREILRAGANKISINSAAVRDKTLITNGAKIFGSQCIIIAIDVKKMPSGGYNVFINGGRIDTGIDALSWAKEVEKLGAGEILLTSMDADGTKNGFDLEITKEICDLVNIPVIASGGCGKIEHFSEVFEKTGANAALAASIFHFKELEINEVKKYLKEKNIEVRI